MAHFFLGTSQCCLNPVQQQNSSPIKRLVEHPVRKFRQQGMFLQLKNKTPTFVILLKEDNSTHSFSSCQHCHGLQGRHSTSFSHKCSERKFSRRSILTRNNFLKARIDRQSEFGEILQYESCDRHKNRSDLISSARRRRRRRSRPRDRRRGSKAATAFLFHVQDKTRVYVGLGLEPPTLWLVELLI